MGREKMMEGEKGMMKTNQEIKNKNAMMKDNAGMMEKTEQEGNMRKEETKGQEKGAMKGDL